MISFKNINTLIFDFGGVLVNLDKERCIQNFKELGFSDVEFFLGEFLQSGFFLDFEKGIINVEAFYSEIRKRATINITDEEIERAWNSFLINIPAEKLDMVLELKKKFKVLLLSNTNPIHIKYAESIFKKHKDLSMADYFDKCYLSYQLGVAKPDSAIYEKLISDANITPNECLFLDDGLKNIEKGKQVGFQTYLVDKNEKLDFLLLDSTWK